MVYSHLNDELGLICELIHADLSIFNCTAALLQCAAYAFLERPKLAVSTVPDRRDKGQRKVRLGKRR